MSGKSNSSEKKKAKGGDAKTDKKLYVAIAVGLVIIAALVTIIFILLTREPEQLQPGPGIGGYPREIGGRGFVVTEDNVEEVREELERRRLAPEDMYFEFSTTPDWVFPTSLTPSPNAVIRNVERNSRTIFFDIEIEGYGVVYVSPYLPLGTEHRNFALDVELEAGTYQAVVTHFLVDDDLEIITDVSIGMTIIVES